MNGDHVHIEVAVERNGTYWLVDPIPALKEAMGGKPVPAPIDTVPYQWDAPNRNLFEVTAGADRIAHQRADPSSKPLYTIKKGERFEAVAWVPGNDGHPWWLLTNGARVQYPEGGEQFTVKVG